MQGEPRHIPRRVQPISARAPAALTTEGGIHQLLLSKVGVGRSFVLEDASEAGPGGRSLPDGYNSFYVHGESGSYSHEYVVPDPAQALPQYIVHFTLDTRVTMPPPSATDMAARKKHFRAHMATVKERVLEALAQLGPAAGDQTEVLLAEIAEKYEQALTASCQEDPLLDERKRSIDKAVAAISAKVEAVQANHKATEDAIYAQMQRVLQQLNSATEAKIAVLLAEELELRRQKEQIDWTESFVGVLADTLPPMSFISAWDKHTAMRSTLYTQAGGGAAYAAASDILDSVAADSRLEGSLRVTSGADTPAGATFLSAGHSPRQAPYSAASAALPPYDAHFSSTPATLASTLPPPTQPYTPSVTFAPSPPATYSTPALPPAPASTAMVPAAAPEPATVQQAQAAVHAAHEELASTTRLAASMPSSQAKAAHDMVAAATAKLQAAQATHAGMVQAEAYKSLAAAGTPLAQGGSAAVPRPRPPAAAPPSPALDGFAALSPDGREGHGAGGAAARSPPTRSVKALVERHSLSAYVESRKRGLGDAVMMQITPDKMFPDSRVLTSADASMRVFLCLPFESGAMGGTFGGGFGSTGSHSAPPTTRKIFSSADAYPPGLAEFPAHYTSWVTTNGSPVGTVVLVKSGGHLFGGYTPEPWRFDGNFHGSPKAFLFSLTRDCKVPYTGRKPGPAQDADRVMRAEHEEQNINIQINFEQARQAEIDRLLMEGVSFDEVGNVMSNPRGADVSKLDIPPPRKRPWFRVDAQRSTPDTLQFGVGDLVLAGDLSECTTQLESSFGIGLQPGSVETRTFFGGAADGVFKADVVEVWAVQHEGAGYGGFGGDFGGSSGAAFGEEPAYDDEDAGY